MQSHGKALSTRSVATGKGEMEKFGLVGNYQLVKQADGRDWWLMRPDGSTVTVLTEQDALGLAVSLKPRDLEALADEIVEAVYANEDSSTAVLNILRRETRSE